MSYINRQLHQVPPIIWKAAGAIILFKLVVYLTPTSLTKKISFVAEAVFRQIVGSVIKESARTRFTNFIGRVLVPYVRDGEEVDVTGQRRIIANLDEQLGSRERDLGAARSRGAQLERRLREKEGELTSKEANFSLREQDLRKRAAEQHAQLVRSSADMDRRLGGLLEQQREARGREAEVETFKREQLSARQEIAGLKEALATAQRETSLLRQEMTATGTSLATLTSGAFPEFALTAEERPAEIASAASGVQDEEMRLLFSSPEKLFEDPLAFGEAVREECEPIIRAIFEAQLAFENASSNVRQVLSLREVIKAKKTELVRKLEGYSIAMRMQEDKSCIIVAIESVGAALVAKRREQKKHELICKYHPHLRIDRLSGVELESHYNDSLQQERQMVSLQDGINKLICCGNIDPALKPLFQVKIEFTGNRERSFRVFAASTRNSGLGYSLYGLLTAAGVVNGQWDGEQEFRLAKADLGKLSHRLGVLDRWMGDATKLFEDLLQVEDPREYIEVGQKSAFETISSLRQSSTEKGRRVLLALPGDFPCLLLGQVSLNLEGHPQRDFLKSEIESIYRQEKMKSADAKDKQFVIGTYRTNLDVPQLKLITHRLNTLLKFQQFAMALARQHTLVEALGVLVGPGKRFVTKFDLSKHFYLLMTEPAIRDIVESAELLRIMATLKRKFDAMRPDGESSFDELERERQQTLEACIQANTAPYFKGHPSSYTPSEEDITRLYGTERKKAYGRTVGVFGDLGRLFDSLRNAVVVRTILQKTPEISGKLDGLREALEERLVNKYPTMSETGWPSSKKLMREAIKSLEIYVASVVYQNRSRFTEESIETSLAQLTGLDIRELKAGCDEGLVGRVLSLSIPLSLSQNASIDSSLLQLQKECLEGALVDFVGADRYQTGNSSHAPIYLDELRNYLTIARLEGTPQKTYSTLSEHAKEMFVFFLKRYSAKEVYRKAESYYKNLLWVLTLEVNTEASDARFYSILKDVGFSQDEAELDIKYRVKGDKANPWQYAYIEQDISLFLTRHLIQKGALIISSTIREGYLCFQKAREEFKMMEDPELARVRRQEEELARVRRQAYVPAYAGAYVQPPLYPPPPHHYVPPPVHYNG